MTEKIYKTENGNIHYWIHHEEGTAALVFLPGLTADHRLFEKQISHFQKTHTVFVWDAPGHNASYPFVMDFTLADKARWLDEILDSEGIVRPVLIGQSMGGYVGQMYAQLFPEKIGGFIAIDSAPLQRKFTTGWEIWLLCRMEKIYLYYPWKALLRSGTNGVAMTPYGRALMREMMLVYDGQKARYAKLAGHGMKMLGEAMAADLPYRIPCPSLLLCGTKDKAGSCIRYSKAWHRETGIPLTWIEGAGHNANTDAPERVNALIEAFLRDG